MQADVPLTSFHRANVVRMMDMRTHFAGALNAMLKGAMTSAKPYSLAERKLLDLGEQVYTRFRALCPSPSMGA